MVRIEHAERSDTNLVSPYSCRDGTPFINLIMCVPLRDQHNRVRYFLGAQLDITGLVNDCTELASLQKLVDQQTKQPQKGSNEFDSPEGVPHDAFEQLGETFNSRELEVLLKLRRRLNPGLRDAEVKEKESLQEHPEAATLKTSTPNLNNIFKLNGQGSAPPLGFYQNVSSSIALLGFPTESYSIYSSDHIHPSVFSSLLLTYG